MQVLKPHFLIEAVLTGNYHRRFQTASYLLIRSRNRIKREPGIEHLKSHNRDDEDFFENFENEQHFSDEVMDFMQLDKALDQHNREKSKNKRFTEKKITEQKYFKPKHQPNMLTYHERRCIQHLHQEDSIKWDVETLSESFPATPDVIRKILKNKYDLTLENIKRLDRRVQKNWELLAENKLEADEHVLNHLKKFVNRRENLLQQIKSIDYYLPEPKKEDVNINSEIRNILNKYEKSLEKLHKPTTKALLQSGVESKNIDTHMKEEKSNIDILHEEIIAKKSQLNVDSKETFTLGKLNSSAHMTLDGLQKNVLNKAESKQKLSISEKAILESNFKASNSESNDKNQPSNSTDSNQFLNMDKLSKKNLGNLVNENHKNKMKITQTPSFKIKSNGPKQTIKKENYKLVERDDKTYLLTETNIGEMVNFDDKQNITVVKPVTLEPRTLPTTFVHEWDFDKEERDIMSTPFWNNNLNSESKKSMESKKAPLGGPSVGMADNSMQRYPERIKIPKSKRGSGLTFKVKDCFYDDDGEFLYRVPGLTN